MSRPRIALIALAIAFIACLGPKQPAATTTSVARPAQPSVAIAADGRLLRFALSESTAADSAGPPIRLASSTALGERETAAVLARLAPLGASPDDARSFAFPAKSLPPPQPGTTLSNPFPPPASAQPAPPHAGAAPPEVVRHAPEGEVPVAPHVSIAFSEPMVAITSQAALSAQAPKASLSPQPPGTWRWVGSKTLLFDPGSPRLPMATDFTVEVPATTQSAAGARIARAVRWSFATPPPKVQQFHPQADTVRPDALMFVAFDQRVDPHAVLGSIALRANGATRALRLASEPEIAGDDTVRGLVQASESSGSHGRYVVVRAEQPLPADAAIEVAVGPGTPSAEGPRKSSAIERFAFRTFGPLRLSGSECGYDGTCEPLAPWFVHWSNPIDAVKFDRSMLRVTPELPELHVEASYETISITGRSRANTTYRVTFASNLTDIFGQTLAQQPSVSFQVGRARPALVGPGGPLTVLEPAAEGQLSVFSVNQPSLRLRAYAVRPEDWDAYLNFMRERERERDDKGRAPPGKKLIDTAVQVSGDLDALTETRLDLTPALSAAGRGHVIVQVLGTAPAPKDRPWERQELHTWVQVTAIGLTAFADRSELIGWASALADGASLEGVELSLWPDGNRARTASDGLARLALRTQPGRMLVARRGDDSAFLPESSAYWFEQGGWASSQPSDSLVWYVADDRNVYRPGESLRFKGWLRKLSPAEHAEHGELGLTGDAIRKVTWTLHDAQGNPLGKGESALTSLGGFDGKLELPKNMNLGSARLEFQALGAAAAEPGTALQFEVQEFRRPEFEVSASASAGPHFVGEAATVTAGAKYYAGGALPQAETHWQLSASPASFVPPNRDDFTFGIWKPWWILGRGDAGSLRGGIAGGMRSGKIAYPGPGAGEAVTETFEARTDATGEHHLRVDFLSANPPQPTLVRADVAVSDVNRQQWWATTDLLVHPAAHYVGLRSERYFVQPGEALPIEAIVVDLDGKAQLGRPIQIRAARLQWEQVAGELQEQEVDAQVCDLQSEAGPVRCTFHPQQGGQYRISALIHDERGRPNLTQFVRWVAGEKTLPQRELAQETVTLIPSRKQFQPGQEAEVLVMAPFFPAEGTLSLRRSGILQTQRFRMDGPSHVLRVPLEDAYTPNVYLQVDLVGSAARSDDAGNPDAKRTRRPAYASGQLNLELPPRSRSLALEVKPASAALEPGASTKVDLVVRGADGKPVAGAELAVAVVDEAVLALSDYRWPDPLSVFYAQRESGTEDADLRQHVLLVDPESTARDAARPRPSQAKAMPEAAALGRRSLHTRNALMADAAMANSAAPPAIALRSDFAALAAFSAVLVTDAAGHAQLPLRLPDNLTRYRVMALAAHGEGRFGSGEAVITARLPLMVRPSAPRFLNFGDAFELPVVVQNQTDAPLDVDLAVRAANAEPRAGLGRRLTVPAHDRVELRFPAAAKLPGTARFQVAGVSGAVADAAEFALPVWTPATSEAFASYGAIDAGAVAQKISAPPDVWPEFGGLELTTSSTALQALTDAVLYLVDYPFECSEQMASRLLALAALKDVLGAFEAKGLPPQEQLLASVGRDLETLGKIQNDDGGFGFWRHGEPSWPYLSIHVAHALARLRDKGFAVPPAVLERVHGYVKAIESHIPDGYAAEARQTLIAYALYTRQLLGDPDRDKARALLAQGGGAQKLNLEALGFLYPVLARDPAGAAALASIRQQLHNRVEETAATAHFTTAYSDGADLLLHSERRADAVLLEGLIADQPRSDLIPKLVAGLLAQRRAGRWESTQENAFVLLALDRYFARYEKTTPDFVARAWLGSTFAAEQRYRGRSTEQHLVELPMSYLQARPNSDLVLEKTGPGRLYYRLGMQYAPRDLAPSPVDHGFTVERIYEAVDAPGDVRRTPDGAWQIRAGARVRVRVTMVAQARRYHVALVDPLPAGLEVLNPALAVNGAPPDPPFDPMIARKGSFWWGGRWYEHENLRDQRVEAFSSLLWEGVHEYAYIARATTPGTFVAPPPKAEEMYHPETFGRGAGDRVIIAD